jgi:UDP-glucose 4-epimerase
MKTTILITGGAGNVASSLATKLAMNNKYHIIIVDNLLTGSLQKVPKSDNVSFYEIDVNDSNKLRPIFEKYAIHYVFHYAAVVGVQRTLDNPLMVFNDIDGIKNILELSKDYRVKRVFYSSSSEVYGEPFEIPQNEQTTPLNSRLPYAIVKNLGEAMFKAYQKEFDLPYTIFRFFNTYGPNQSEDFVVPRFIKMALKNEPITIYGDGSQTRTFCYIDDNIDTCIKIFESDLCINDVVNIGNDYEMSIKQLAEMVIKTTKSSSTIKHLPALKDGDMSRRCPDSSKMKSILQREFIDLETGIRKLIIHYENRQ